MAQSVGYLHGRGTGNVWRMIAADGSEVDRAFALNLSANPDKKLAPIKIMCRGMDVTMALTGGRGLRDWMIPAVLPVLDGLTYEQAREMIMAMV